jgi:MarR family transcriptional regulator, organic hydroperoxide resistance regulator
MATRVSADAATESWQLILEVLLSERPPRIPAVAHEFDLSPMGVHVMRMLEPGTELPMSAVADFVGCDASNITGIVDRMEARGLIERRDSSADRRVKLIALTPEGAEQRARLMERLHEPPAVIAALTQADQRTLRDVLRRALDGS